VTEEALGSGATTRYYTFGGAEFIVDATNAVTIKRHVGDAVIKALVQTAPTTQMKLDLLKISRYGFTGHEMVDDLNIIHMNGRIYDPTIGRFLQADPTVQAPTDSQSFNRYSYVRNNPTNLTDPSGYSWLSKTWKKLWKNPVFKMVVIAVAAYFTAGMVSGWASGMVLASGEACTAASVATASIVGGIAGGAAGGFVAGALATGTFKGGMAGAATGAVFGGIGAYADVAQWGPGAHAFAHGMAGGAISVAQGDKFGHGFISAGLTQYADINGGAMGQINGVTGVMARTAAAAAWWDCFRNDWR